MPCDPKLMPTFPHHRNNSSGSGGGHSSSVSGALAPPPLAPPAPQMYTMNFGSLASSLSGDLLHSSRK
jgi:hypothetical protein